MDCQALKANLPPKSSASHGAELAPECVKLCSRGVREALLAPGGFGSAGCGTEFFGGMQRRGDQRAPRRMEQSSILQRRQQSGRTPAVRPILISDFSFAFSSSAAQQEGGEQQSGDGIAWFWHGGVDKR
jgi:hypothetical protein